jgi:hypothetical protein
MLQGDELGVRVGASRLGDVDRTTPPASTSAATAGLTLREIRASDSTRVLELNRADVHLLSPMSGMRLAWILSMCTRSVAVENRIGEMIAFALALPPGTGYDSENYGWFTSNLDGPFLYLDRVVVDAAARREGAATQIYNELERTAATFGQMVCDISLDPPNDPSLAFHRARGYAEMGRITHPDGTQSALFARQLARTADG